MSAGPVGGGGGGGHMQGAAPEPYRAAGGFASCSKLLRNRPSGTEKRQLDASKAARKPTSRAFVSCQLMWYNATTATALRTWHL